MSRPFFFRIDAGDLLNFAVDAGESGVTLLSFARDLQRGESEIPFIQSIINEAYEFSKKKSDAANLRWEREREKRYAQHMQDDAPHIQSYASNNSS